MFYFPGTTAKNYPHNIPTRAHFDLNGITSRNTVNDPILKLIEVTADAFETIR